MTTNRSILARAAGLAIGATIRSTIPLSAGLAVLAPLATAAAQQVKAVEPYFVTVTKDNVPMKCADGGIFYAVSILKQGQVLRVDGEGPGWLRTEYLPGIKAYIKAADATADASGKTLKLSRPSRLMAANVQGSRPWQFLLDSDLPAGTSFTVLETLKGTDGTVEGYLVPAPAQARGYVKSDQVKRATPEEAAAYTKPASGAATPPAPRPQPVKPTTPATGGDPVPAPTTPPPATPTTPPSAIPATPEGEPAVPADPNATTPVPPPVAPPTPPVDAPRLKVIKDIDTLRTLFNNVMQKAGSEAEINTVIAEFDRTTNTLGGTPEDRRIHEALTSRREALTLRLEVFEASKKLRDRATAISERELKLREYVDNVEKQSIYTIVGRIVPSTVYDGKRGMPLMFRVESADSSSTRTLGYVVPREGLDLLTVSGKVVGIVGESRIDESLRLNIVAARRVTVLNPASAPRPIEPTPAEEVPTGPAEATGANEKPGE